MLSEEEAKKVRQALINQIESMNLSEEEKDQAIEKISQMSPEQLEKFVKPSNQCIFCAIVNNQVESYKIAENSDAIVVLEINPLSKGHSLVIPKNHIPLTEFSIKVYELLHDNIKNIKSKINPKEINISSSEFEGHGIINILPITGSETGKREKATKEQLEEVQKLLKIEEKKPEEKPVIEDKKSELPEKEPEIVIEKAPVRVP